MLDAAIRPHMNKPLEVVAQRAVALGMSAERGDGGGFALGIAAAALIAAQYYWAGLGVLLFSRFMDGLDGAIARLTQLTDVGGYLDITLDFIFYAAVVFAFALADPAAQRAGGGVSDDEFHGAGVDVSGLRDLCAEARHHDRDSRREVALLSRRVDRRVRDDFHAVPDVRVSRLGFR